MELSFTDKKKIRKSFGKLENIVNIPDLIEVQKKSVKDTSDLNKIVSDIFKKGEKTLLLTVINKNNQRNYLGVKIN